MPKIVKLPCYKWSENPRLVDFPLPDNWNVTQYDWAGANSPVMTPEQVRAAINAPIGSPCLRELAKGKKKVVIIFDDMTRGTQVSKIVPFVLEELTAGGITDGQIEFICAQGAHQSWDWLSLSRKVGKEIIAKYPVFAHCPFMNCTPLGKTKYGSRVEVNSEVMSCDLKITIGGCFTHGRLGFGGGGKTIMPGVASYDAIAEHHAVTHRDFGTKRRASGFTSERGFAKENPFTLDAIEMAKMAGVDFIINVMQDYWGDPVAIFCGALEPTYFTGIQEAEKHYRVTCPDDNDIVICNGFTKAAESTGAVTDGWDHLKSTGGDAVLIITTWYGQVVHYHGAAFGKSIGGRNHRKSEIPAHVNHIIYYSEFPEARIFEAIAEKDRHKVQQTSNWTEVVLNLLKWHPDSAQVAVFTDGIGQISSNPS